MSDTNTTEVLPRFKLVVLDETSNWPKEIVAKAEKIYRTYIFDANRAVHCCEITPSYELFPVCTTPLIDDREGTLEEMLCGGEDYDVVYWHAHRLDRLPPTQFYDCGQEVSMPDDYDDCRDAHLDYCRGNAQLQFPTNVFGTLREETLA